MFCWFKWLGFCLPFLVLLYISNSTTKENTQKFFQDIFRCHNLWLCICWFKTERKILGKEGENKIIKQWIWSLRIHQKVNYLSVQKSRKEFFFNPRVSFICSSICDMSWDPEWNPYIYFVLPGRESLGRYT